MRAGRASRTAEHNALFRALESAAPPSKRLFEDPLAHAFVTWPVAPVLRLATALPGDRGRRALCRYIDGRWLGVRSTVAARTRLIDDTLAELVEVADDGVAQVVVLGAGYDTRAYRLPSLRHARTVFEVDHPDTQAAKRRALARALPELPAHVRFVATDFEQQSFESAMAEAGFRPDVVTVVVWEGVTNYLTSEAVDATMRWCSRLEAGSTLVFTYVHRDVITDPGRYAGTDRLRATLDGVGERFTFGIDPAQLRGYLWAMGLTLSSDVGAAELRAQYLGPEADGIHGHEFYRVAVARVGA